MPIQNSREGQSPLEPGLKPTLEDRYRASKIIYLNLSDLLPLDQLQAARVVKAGDIIRLPAPQSAIIVREGLVNMTMPGAFTAVKGFGPGCVFGDIPLLRMETFNARFRAAVYSKVVFVGQDLLQVLILKSPMIALRVIDTLTGKVREFDTDLLIKGLAITDDRLFRLLRALADEGGVVDDASKQDLGRVMGLSRQAVGRSLGRLKSQGLIATSRMRIKLLKPSV
jgi:CRP-like cAMP-binding protein